MSRYIFQRSGGPLMYWAHGQPPPSARAADARALGALGCGGGGCGCTSCKPVAMGLADSYLRTPRGAAQRYPMGAVPILPGAPEPLTDVPSDLIDPYETLSTGGKPTGGIGVGTVIVAGLGLALAYPYLKKLLG